MLKKFEFGNVRAEDFQLGTFGLAAQPRINIPGWVLLLVGGIVLLLFAETLRRTGLGYSSV